MSFICIICHDLITTKGQNADATRGSDIVATKCGHLYHLNCLNEWFNTQDIPRQECPYCKSRIATNDYQRIFPSGDEETDEILNRYKDAKTQQKANGQLQEEIDERTEQLIDIQGKLEEERLFQDLLMYEHSLLMNRFSELKNHAAILETRDINMTKELQQKCVKLEKADIITLSLTTQLNQAEIKNTELKTKLGKQEKKTKILESEMKSLRSRDLVQSQNMERLQACSNGFPDAKFTTYTAAGASPTSQITVETQLALNEKYIKLLAKENAELELLKKKAESNGSSALIKKESFELIDLVADEMEDMEIKTENENEDREEGPSIISESDISSSNEPSSPSVSSSSVPISSSPSEEEINENENELEENQLNKIDEPIVFIKEAIHAMNSRPSSPLPASHLANNDDEVD